MGNWSDVSRTYFTLLITGFLGTHLEGTKAQLRNSITLSLVVDEWKVKPVGGFNPSEKKNVSQNEDVPQDMGETKHLKRNHPSQGKKPHEFPTNKILSVLFHHEFTNTRFPLVQKKSSNRCFLGKKI